MKEKLYIAYGSNLDQRQMARRCPTAEVVCSGMLYGHELLFRGSQFGAVATVVPKPGACVPVLVWKIKPSDERALDLYEGFPHLYRKENLSVTMDGGERDIMAYVMTGEREYGVPARSYYETIARGYADAGFDIGVLNEAVQESVRRMLDENGYDNVRIEVDGNVSFENAVKMRAAGADLFVAGTSAVFRDGGIEANMKKLLECIR